MHTLGSRAEGVPALFIIAANSPGLATVSASPTDGGKDQGMLHLEINSIAGRTVPLHGAARRAAAKMG